MQSLLATQAVVSTLAGAAEVAPVDTDAVFSSKTTPMVVAASVNGEAKADLFIQRADNGDFFIRHDDLPLLGLRLAAPARMVLHGELHVSLQAIAGLSFALDEGRLRLEITANPSLLTRTVIDARPQRRRADRIVSNSAFLNWAAQASSRGSDEAQLAAEGGLRLGPVQVASNGNTLRRADDTHRFVRLMTTAALDIPDTLQRWTAGDLITSASELGGSVNLGGLAVTKLYGLDPYQVRYPMGLVRGQALLPSEVEVYLDGQRVRTERVRPGEFQINELSSQQGARTVQLVVRDAFGRVQQFDYSLYTSDRLLRQGFSEYQYAVGALRRDYGTRSFEYGTAAVVAHHRYGLNDDVTLGLRAEGRRGLVTVGPSTTLRLGTRGVLSASLSLSQAEAVHGRAALVQYAYESARWGLGVLLRRESAGFTSLSEPLVLSNRKWGGQLYVGRSWTDFGTLWLSHAVQTAHAPDAIPLPAGFELAPQSPRRSTGVGYATYLQPLRSSLRFGLSRVSDTRGPRNEFNLSVSIALDGQRLLTAGTRRTVDGHLQTVQLTRALPIAEGWGYDLSGEHPSGQARHTEWRGAAQINARYLQLRGDLRTREGEGSPAEALRLNASGGMVWLDGRVYFGRPVQGSFAVVEVAGLKDVPVTLNGMAVGLTDEDGRIFVPRISPHYESDIGIDTRAVPVDYSFAQISRRVVLPERSGALIDFQATRVQAVVARLVRTVAGQARPLARVQVRVALTQGELRAVTGSGGELYLENLPPGQHEGVAHLAASSPDASCRFQLHLPATDTVILELGDLVCVANSEYAKASPSGHAQNLSAGPR